MQKHTLIYTVTGKVNFAMKKYYTVGVGGGGFNQLSVVQSLIELPGKTESAKPAVLVALLKTTATTRQFLIHLPPLTLFPPLRHSLVKSGNSHSTFSLANTGGGR